MSKKRGGGVVDRAHAATKMAAQREETMKAVWPAKMVEEWAKPCTCKDASSKDCERHPNPTGIGTSPSAPVTIDPADEAKVRSVQRQVAEHKTALGDLQLRYENQKAHVIEAMKQCETRAMHVVTEAMVAKGLDPGRHDFDWNACTIIPKK